MNDRDKISSFAGKRIGACFLRGTSVVLLMTDATAITANPDDLFDNDGNRFDFGNDDLPVLAFGDPLPDATALDKAAFLLAAMDRITEEFRREGRHDLALRNQAAADHMRVTPIPSLVKLHDMFRDYAR